MAQRFELRGGAPTIKLLHSFATHGPYVMNDDCRTIGRGSLAHLTSQAHCTLEAVAKLLDRMKSADVYDNSVILIMADHGTSPGNYPDEGTDSHDAWVHLAGAAHPLFMVKRHGRRGPIEQATAPVYLPDTGATLCAATGDCAVADGIPAGQAPSDRPRRFYNYIWKHDYWQLRDVPAMAAYDIRGPVGRADSWVRVH